ncbi:MULTISPECIES: o-succinylbenzoate synthase [unclassified Enterococcus]|jgi:O-succinylbenzoate synthase|uniref:o-succinylbenzoate synthase n=1 Tax=unclassified Enterococcus TaxID=2608891 RepID=UPI003D291AC5
MKISAIDHYQMKLPLKTPFKTSYGELTEKAFDLLVLYDEKGNYGIGELVSFEAPEYIEETLQNSREIINTHLLPLLFGTEIAHPKEIREIFQTIQGNFMAKSALETAVWDLFARRNGKSLREYFYPSAEEIAVGVSVGIQPSHEKLLSLVADYQSQGYRRIKLKIKPGYDIQPLHLIRKKFPELLVMADANSAYSAADIPLFKKIDQLGLAMIEQPFSQRDFVEHARLQAQIKTPICLDENIRTLDDVKTAYALKSCCAVNLKIPRVGGISEAMDIASFCQKNDLIVWLGGMFESGVGRALNLQFASQPMFHFPGDISGADRYYPEDIVQQPALIQQGKIKVPTGKGIGAELAMDKIEKYTYKKSRSSANDFFEKQGNT